ncbi:hypothetical protein D9613_003947 [Agrocybe pediades]|uniref:N-acetyltransferase domain-containing protein n=1 Tax=Agrocybe pediades TaxID=84607 RepID=A0A8H4VJ85_9AGAR|nr:hypothetical protein D9613_003947 [Agrocybe pediades]
MDSTSFHSSGPVVRLATPDEFLEIAYGAMLAFLHDPVLHFFSNASKAPLDPEVDERACKVSTDFYYLLTNSCYLVGGRIMVVVDRPEGSADEKIVSVAAWYPPGNRLAAWMIPTLLRSRFLSVLWGWGFEGFKRIDFDYHATVEHKFDEFYKEKGWKEPMDDSWYLQYIYTLPEHQGKGHCSRLIREAFAHAPDAMFTLEATTAKSRNQYEHLGFDHCEGVRLGTGKCDTRGVRATGKGATGFDVWVMAKRPSKRKEMKSK